MPKCPGQDMRYWKPEDIFEAKCPHCTEQIEFWKDEPKQICPKCGGEAANPRTDPGCSDWCKHAEDCTAIPPKKKEK